MKSRKIRASYWLFWPIKECSFDRIDVFLTDHVNERRGFFMENLKKIAREHRVFTEWTVFDKICGLELRVFTEWTVFWQNMGMRASIFSWKIRKKRASYWLFWPIIECRLDRIGVFLTNYVHDSRGFSWKSSKKVPLGKTWSTFCDFFRKKEFFFFEVVIANK